MTDLWHAAYCRWYDHREAGNARRAATWGWVADRICQHLTSQTAGVNDGQGTTFLPDGADAAPDESKGAAAPTATMRPAPAVTHECVFGEEQEPSGRLILPPCIVCGLTAMDALEQLRGERVRPCAYMHEPCGTVATAEWVESSNGACTSCEWVTNEGWTALVRDFEASYPPANTPEPSD